MNFVEHELCLHLEPHPSAIYHSKSRVLIAVGLNKDWRVLMIIQADLRSRSNIVTWPSLSVTHHQETSSLFALRTEIASLCKGMDKGNMLLSQR